MSVSRRHFLYVGVGLLVSGCAARTSQRAASLPPPLWPEAAPRPRPVHAGVSVPQPSQVLAPPPPAPASPAAPAARGLQAIPRTRWASAGPIMGRLNPMNGVQRITVHHEGWNAVWFSDVEATAERLDLDRRSHINRMGAGDLGYHYVIDRAGRLWAGRDVRYQGAHVRGENPHNVGVMVLGNFDVQSPSDAQLATLRQALTDLMKEYRVAVGRVFTHQELNPTACPGRALQPRMVTLRRNLA